MSGVSKTQKEQVIKQFVSLTRATPTDAARLCKKAGYRVDVAVDYFYGDYQAQMNAERAQAVAAKSDKSGSQLEAQFSKYKDPENASLTDIDGSLRYFSDLSLEPEDPTIICLAHMLRAPRMGVFDKKGFIDGWKSALAAAGYTVSSGELVALQRAELGRLRERLTKDPAYFEEVYRYTFDFGKDEGQKSFALESAIAFWQMLMPLAPQVKSFPETHLEWWFELLRSRNRAVSRDTWNLFLDFVKDIDLKFENHDEFAAWPSVIDDFVECGRNKLGSGAVMDTS